MPGAVSQVSWRLPGTKVLGACRRTHSDLIKLGQATAYQICSPHQSHISCNCHQTCNLMSAAQHFQLIQPGYLTIYHLRAGALQSRPPGCPVLRPGRSPGRLSSCTLGFTLFPATAWWSYGCFCCVSQGLGSVQKQINTRAQQIMQA